MARQHPCPICKKIVQPTSRSWPFCSERCRLIDLGNWLGNKYVVPGDEKPPPSDDDDA